jgi:hypothetical protein
MGIFYQPTKVSHHLIVNIYPKIYREGQFIIITWRALSSIKKGETNKLVRLCFKSNSRNALYSSTLAPSTHVC